MSRRAATAALLAVAAGVAGCTSASTGSASKFTGAQGDVAKVVSDLQQAGQRKDAQKICTQILAQTLVHELDAAGTSCRRRRSGARATGR